ncbi:MAG: hypothetical protein JWM44_2666 [Bacilli bacterium]|nr:hypothetical protein [Bacilli bacterium]
MNHPAIDRAERTGYPITIVSPSTKYCSCGCGELVVSSFAYCKYDGEAFVDNFHVLSHLKNIGLLQEVG